MLKMTDANGKEFEPPGAMLHLPPMVYATTRDQWRYHFAGLAMQGLLANPHVMLDSYEIATRAAQQADEMLAELEKPK